MLNILDQVKKSFIYFIKNDFTMINRGDLQSIASLNGDKTRISGVDIMETDSNIKCIIKKAYRNEGKDTFFMNDKIKEVEKILKKQGYAIVDNTKSYHSTRNDTVKKANKSQKKLSKEVDNSLSYNTKVKKDSERNILKNESGIAKIVKSFKNFNGESFSLLKEKKVVDSSGNYIHNKKNGIYVLQIALKFSGYEVGKIDGLYGKNTFAGLKEWQEKSNLYTKGVDAIPGKGTMTALFKEITNTTEEETTEETTETDVERIEKIKNKVEKQLDEYYNMSIEENDIYSFIEKTEKGSLNYYDAYIQVMEIYIEMNTLRKNILADYVTLLDYDETYAYKDVTENNSIDKFKFEYKLRTNRANIKEQLIQKEKIALKNIEIYKAKRAKVVSKQDEIVSSEDNNVTTGLEKEIIIDYNTRKEANKTVPSEDNNITPVEPIKVVIDSVITEETNKTVPSEDNNITPASEEGIITDYNTTKEINTTVPSEDNNVTSIVNENNVSFTVPSNENNVSFTVPSNENNVSFTVPSNENNASFTVPSNENNISVTSSPIKKIKIIDQEVKSEQLKEKVEKQLNKIYKLENDNNKYYDLNINSIINYSNDIKKINKAIKSLELSIEGYKLKQKVISDYVKLMRSDPKYKKSDENDKKYSIGEIANDNIYYIDYVTYLAATENDMEFYNMHMENLKKEQIQIQKLKAKIKRLSK